jgi:hypothetical protein
VTEYAIAVKRCEHIKAVLVKGRQFSTLEELKAILSLYEVKALLEE